MDEFELIRRHFNRHVKSPDVMVGIGDDGAVLRPVAGQNQVQVIDTLVEGVHIPSGSNAADIGYRLVIVNLSDIAAMGARPLWMTLALTLPHKEEQWVADFAEGLFEAAEKYGVALVGGDTTYGELLVATLHVSGTIKEGGALLRSGARVGDTIFVTGTLGDAAAGLQLLQNGEHDDFLTARFLRPSARVETGRRLVGNASAVIDLSDGLVGDLGKLLEASGVGGELEIESVPVSSALKSRFDSADRTRFALTGGDDYELCFTAQPNAVDHIAGVTPIGRVVRGSSLVCRNKGVVVKYDDRGYRHFQ